MPFTLAHPAAVLPFLRQPFVPIALVAGAMAPDLPYFAMVSSTSDAWYEPILNGSNSHDLTQILSVGLPLALVLCGFLWLVARPLRWATPDSWVPAKTEPAGRKPSSARIALWIFYSLMLGLFTHIAWDAFTHSHGWVVQQLPFLGTEVISGFPIYRILQHLSTVLGLLIILRWYLKRLKATPVPVQEQRTQGVALRATLVGALLLVPTLVVAGLAVAGGLSSDAGLSVESFLWIAITRGGAALIIVLVAYGLVWQVAALVKTLRTANRTRP
ncbi:MAG: DUF4184 family protein [Micrococcaceae bacterium]|nr:DUF4184 family protein [Micrococcaceae bacterium]